MTSFASGVVYIIGERDHKGASTNLYKIGIVRQGDGNRTVDHRLADHQTGNPRELYIAHCATSDFVERVETLLHGQFATSRIGGEGFHLPEGMLQEAISELKTHVTAANAHAPHAVEAKRLASQISNGITIDPSELDVKIHSAQSDVRQQLAACKAAMSHLTTQLVTIQNTTQPERPWVNIEHKSGKTNFDKRAFELAHPDTYARYLTSRIKTSKTFRLSKITDNNRTLCEINAPLAALCDESTKMTSDSHSGQIIHQQYLKVLSQHTVLKWEDERMDAQLRVACGANDGIDGICTWKRQSSDEYVLDVAALERNKPELYQEFLTTSKSTTALNPVKDLGYRV